MSVRDKIVLVLALFAVLVIGASSASATLMDPYYTDHAYDDGVNPPWYGSFHYDENFGPIRLVGDLDWAVFTASEFSSLFGSGYTPTQDELVYTYQLHNDDQSTYITLHEVFIQGDAPVDHAGWFEDPLPSPDVTGQVPFNSYVDMPFVIWDFRDGFNIQPGESSMGLAFCSPRKPTYGLSITVNGGASTLNFVATPGTENIPEPSTIVMLTIAATIMGFCAIRRR